MNTSNYYLQDRDPGDESDDLDDDEFEDEFSFVPKKPKPSSNPDGAFAEIELEKKELLVVSA